MTGILLSGCNGKMGKVITAAAANTDDIEIVGGIDLNTEAGAGYPVFASPTEVTPEVLARTDVIIDFSNPSAFAGLIEFAVKAAKPAVFATTGLNEAQLTLLHHAADKIPVFFAANMSLGVSLISELAQKAAKVLGDDFDIEIVEMHHNQKVDAPSGTALMLADSIKEAPLARICTMNTTAMPSARNAAKNEIGIHPSGAHDNRRARDNLRRSRRNNQNIPQRPQQGAVCDRCDKRRTLPFAAAFVGFTE